MAANLHEFKSIAKKLVPEKLANQLADLASKSSVKYSQEQVSQEDSESPSESLTEDDGSARGARTEQVEKVKEVHLAKINFEELVQKVKERIEKDYEKSQKQIKVDPKEETSAPQSYNQENNLPQVSRFVNKIRKKTTKSLRETNLEEQVDIPLRESAQDDGLTFAKIEMKDNDSYEDYVTPEKEKNIFEGEAKKLDDIQTTTLGQVPEYTNQEMEYAYDDQTEELKAKTEDLWYDYKQTNATIDYRDTTPMRRKTTKKAKGTMIPKRDFYKISSPNYFAKVPIVAEKYNFDEPIPDKDREPEDLKPVIGAPVNINGKIKLTN